MFLGITSHHNALSVHDYTSAQRALERSTKTPTGKQRKLKPQGYHLGLNSNTGVTWARPNEDGSIAFTLYATDVVTWYPDNSVVVDNFGSVTTSGFARSFLPTGIHLRYSVERRGASGGDCGIVYAPTGADNWADRRICFGAKVRFRQHGDGWVPDEDTLAAIRFPELDRARAYWAMIRYPLKDFTSWLSMAPRILEIRHIGWDAETCAEALEARDFRLAAEHLPTIDQTSSWGGVDRSCALPITCRDRDQMITMGSLRKLKLALWEREGCFTTMPHLTLPRSEFERRMRRIREMRALGVAPRDWGSSR